MKPLDSLQSISECVEVFALVPFGKASCLLSIPLILRDSITIQAKILQESLSDAGGSTAAVLPAAVSGWFHLQLNARNLLNPEKYKKSRQEQSLSRTSFTQTHTEIKLQLNKALPKTKSWQFHFKSTIMTQNVLISILFFTAKRK